MDQVEFAQLFQRALDRAVKNAELKFGRPFPSKYLLELNVGDYHRQIVEFAHAAADVKNDEPLRFQLLPETVQILERYLTEWRSKICRQPNPWLFPNSAGGPMDGRSLPADLCHKTQRELGVWITHHQFRHLSTELYLQANPEGLAVASLHLGHRDQNKTRRYYARPKQREATRRYQQHLIEKREGAKRRQVRRRPQGNGPTRDVEHEVQWAIACV
jgi:integrase